MKFQDDRGDHLYDPLEPVKEAKKFGPEIMHFKTILNQAHRHIHNHLKPVH